MPCHIDPPLGAGGIRSGVREGQPALMGIVLYEVGSWGGRWEGKPGCMMVLAMAESKLILGGFDPVTVAT